MNGTTIGGFVVGVVVGVAVGFFVFGDTGGDRGEWPDIPCPEGAQVSASDVLDEITNLAMQVNPPTQNSQACAVMAQQKKMASPPDVAQACAQLMQAADAARGAQWAACKGLLDELD